MAIDNTELVEIERQANAMDNHIEHYTTNISKIIEELDNNIIPTISAEDTGRNEVSNTLKITLFELQRNAKQHFGALAEVMHTYYKNSTENLQNLGSDVGTTTSSIDETISGINSID